MKLKEILIVIIIILLFLISVILNIFGDWFWFVNIGYQNVFLNILYTSIMIGIVTAVSFFIFAFINIKLAKRASIKGSKKVHWKGIDRLFILLTAFFALIIGLGFSSNWETVLKFMNPSNFSSADPVFNLNIAFYTFTLPFYSLIYNFFIVLIILTILLTVLSYFAYSKSIKKVGVSIEKAKFSTYKFDWKGVKQKIAPHLSILLSLLFFVISFGFVLMQYGLLFSSNGVVYGAGYADLNVSLPLFMLLSFISIIVGIMFLLNLKIKRLKLLFELITIFIIIMVLGFIAIGVTHAFIVRPNEFNLEKPYIERNIQNTLDAYNLKGIKETIFPISYNLTKSDIQKNNATINNIRLWDWRPLVQTYNQLQLFRTYYYFNDIDIDRYNLDGKYKQVMISAREMSTENLQSNAKTWVNEHLVYTHGYGVVMNPVDKVSPEGLPVFYIKDIPPSSQFTTIDRPEIYYGEKTSNYVIVKTTTNEFDYPSGDQNIYASYGGKGGIELSDFFRRLVYAVKFGSIELLISGSLKPESKILIYRDIRERVRKIAPFLKYDQDPYVVISDNRLYWILDAYTLTDKYPYSEPVYARGMGYFNYIRNSVKVVVDAYNGDVMFYVIDSEDPVIQTYIKIFPDLFKNFSEMPEGLKNHIRYPEGLFSVQAELYSIYHMKDPMVFYNKEDVWVIPDEIYRGSRQRMTPYYIIMKLPEWEKEEFILMIPFTPKNKENMIAWMAAKCDFPDYGKATVFQFSKQILTYGPMQVEARIDQDTEISQKITLWSQSGSSVIRGNTLVIPIEDSILYIEPLYLEATEKGTLPELKRVIVAYGNKVTMQESLQESIDVIFGEVVIKPEEPNGEKTSEEILAEISDLYKKAQDSLKAGDLAKYAEYMNEIGKLLE